MATSFTSPGLVLASNQAILEAQRAIAFARLFTTDFSAELQGLGKVLKVPVFSGDATEFNETSNNFETTDGAIIPATVTLDKLVKVTYKIGGTDLLEIDKSSTSRNCGVAGGRAIARKIEELIVGKLDYANAVAKASAEYDQKMRDISAEVRRAVQDRDGASAAYIQAQRKSDVQEEAYSLNMKKLEQGLISPIEFQTASNNYLEANAQRLNSLLTYFIKRSVVNYYNGVDYINQ